MDTFAALALATEPPDADILTRMPQPSNESIVTEVMWRNVHGHAIYQMLVLILIIFLAQGLIVDKYDIKCFDRYKTGDKGIPAGFIAGNCKKGTFNPFYTADHYNELGTYSFWTDDR